MARDDFSAGGRLAFVSVVFVGSDTLADRTVPSPSPPPSPLGRWRFLPSDCSADFDFSGPSAMEAGSEGATLVFAATESDFVVDAADTAAADLSAE